MCSTKSYQMSAIIENLISFINKHKNDLSDENFKRYKAFIRDLNYYAVPERVECTVYEKIKNLIKVSNKKFTFVLGAGVSASYGIPNWEELIFRMNFSKYWQNIYGECDNPPKLYGAEETEHTRKNLKNGLFKLNSNLYEWAQYAENNYNQDEELKERTYCIDRPSGSVIKNLDNTLYSVVKDSLYFRASVDKVENTSLEYIYEIAKGKNVDRIITYNYDDCLEYCWESSSTFKCLPIFDKQQLYEGGFNRDELCQIYHVHGFIPKFSRYRETANGFEDIKEAFNSFDGKKLILTEISYDDMQEEIYKWRNDIQVDTLLRYSCIFVGFSATDVNFKRIAKQLAKSLKQRNDSEKPDHFITICLDDYINNFYYNDKPLYCKNGVNRFLDLIKMPENQEKLYPYILAALEMLIDRRDYLVRYGIYPLFTTIEDLPKLLCEIKDS